MIALSHLKSRAILALALLIALNACSLAIPTGQSTTDKPLADNSIGPYPTFSGRLIVINPSRRWQVEVDWQAYTSESGKMRLSHAFSGTVVDFRWNNKDMEIRDNKSPYWRPIQQTELTEQGIVLPPNQLASILLGNIPSHFHQKKSNMWESKESGSLIRLLWQAELKKLTISDIQHGRIAKLMIQ